MEPRGRGVSQWNGRLAKLLLSGAAPLLDTRWTALHYDAQGVGGSSPSRPTREALVSPTFAIAPLSDSARVITK